MTTIATTGSIRNPKLTVTLALSINHMVYTVTPIDHNDPDITRAFRLRKKHDGTLYDVAQGEHGATCDCPDFSVRRDGVAPEGCKHVRALRMMGMLDAAPVIPAAPAPAAVKPTSPLPAGTRCYYCCRLAFLPRLDATGHVNCYECRVEACGVCGRDGTRRVDRADGILICGPCSKRQDEAAELKAFLAAPAPCCSPAEPVACAPCQATLPAVTAADAILAAGLEFARTEAVNQPTATPDHYEDELPDFEPSDEDRQAAAEAFAAMDTQRYLDRSGELPLTEAIDHVGHAFKAWGSPFGSMLAGILEELAAKCFAVGATTPAELLTGLESLDREARESWERIGRESVSKPVTDIDDPAARRGKPSAGYAGGNCMPAMSSRY